MSFFKCKECEHFQKRIDLLERRNKQLSDDKSELVDELISLNDRLIFQEKELDKLRFSQERALKAQKKLAKKNEQVEILQKHLRRKKGK